MHLPDGGGLVGSFIVAVATVAALGRLRRALHNNRRYHFTTWRWGRTLAALLLIGWTLKLVLLAAH